MDIIRKELTPDELQNPNNRYNPDCDCTQTTIDGGATWTDNPGIDPRTSTALLLPVPSTSDPRCDSATGITANFRDGLTQVLANLNTTNNAFAGASVILTILDFLDGIGLLIQLFIDFCALILSIGVELVEADFTDSVYAQFACNLYCDCKDDGTFDAAAFDKLLTDNATSFGEFSTVNIILNSWLNGLGFVGLSNVGSVKRTAGDCSDCACGWCYTFDFTANDGGWSPVVFGGGDDAAWSSAGWGIGVNNACEIGIFIDISEGSTITKAQIVLDSPPTGADPRFAVEDLDGSGLQDGSGNTFTVDFTDGIRCFFNWHWEGLCTDDPNPHTIVTITLHGIGDNPFGTNNC